MRISKSKIIRAGICTGGLATVLLLFMLLNYIDYSVILTVFLPLWVFAMGLILFGQYLVAYFLTAATGLGLIVEYLSRYFQPHPSMRGAFLNTLIIITGLITGIIVQIFVNRIRKR